MKVPTNEELINYIMGWLNDLNGNGAILIIDEKAVLSILGGVEFAHLRQLFGQPEYMENEE